MESSSDESRSSSPGVPTQLPIPKLKINLASLASPKSRSYRPVKIYTGRPRKTNKKLIPTNNLVAKLRSLTCKVDMPRLKFRNRSLDSEDEAEVKLHCLDIEALPGCRSIKKQANSADISCSQPPIAPLKIRLARPDQGEGLARVGQHPSSCQSLSSVLATIVKRPRLKAVISKKEYSEFPEQKSQIITEEDPLFSTSLTKSMAVLVKFADSEICHEILDTIVNSIEETQSICGDIVGEIIEEMVLSETSPTINIYKEDNM